MRTSRWMVLAGAVALAVVGCAKEEPAPAPETCGRFGDAAGRCTVGALEGRARLDGATAHGGIRVSLVGTDHEATTEEDGGYSLEKVPPGEYLVSFDADGYSPRTSRATVRARHVTRIVEAVLSPAKIASRVGGRILLGGRTSHDGTMVSLEGTGIAVFTEDDGSFAFSNVPLGTARITARHPGFETISAELEVDRWEVDTGVRTLDPLPEPGTVAGSVRENGIPVAGASVALAGTDFGAATGADGSFLIEDVAPGSYVLVAVAPGRLPVSIAVDVAPARTVAVPPIDLLPADDVGRLRGFARRLGEAHLGGIEVELREGDVVVASGLTDEAGAYHLSAAPTGIFSLVARAPGFPDLHLPGVALGPEDWDGPELVMRRSVRIDSRPGTGSATPSGRWAFVSYESGSAGTWLWSADTHTQRKILPARAALVAADRAESFATLLVGTVSSPTLVRVELATGKTQEVLPKPDRIYGSFGGSTFYRSAGILFRLLAGETLARRIDVPPFRAAGIEEAEGATVRLALAGYEDPPNYYRIAFDSEQHWNGPVFIHTFGSSPDVMLGIAADGRFYWVHVPDRDIVPITSGPVHGVLEAHGRTFVAEGYDPIRDSFEVTVVDPETGASEPFLDRVRDAWRLGERTLIFRMSDGRWLWFADDGRSTTPSTICAGGTTQMKSKGFACLEDGTGRARVADDSGVRTVSQAASSLGFIDDEVLAWREVGDDDSLHMGSLDRHVVRVPCAGGLLRAEGSGLYQALYCENGLFFVDLPAETVSRLSNALPIECTVGPNGVGLVCLMDEAHGGVSPVRLRAYDLESGRTNDFILDVGSGWAYSILLGVQWRESGRAAVFTLGKQLLQLRFPDTGTPAWASCRLVATPGEVEDFDDEARVHWVSGSNRSICNLVGGATRIGNTGDNSFVRLGVSGWTLVGQAVVLNLSHEIWVSAGAGPRAWWSPPGDHSIYLADSIGLRNFRFDGSVDFIQPFVRPLFGFERVPLLETPTGVQRIGEDGTLIPVASATDVTSGPFGSERSWFAGADGDLYVVDLGTGTVERVAEGVDLARFFDASARGLYFEGEVDGVRGMYRMSPDATSTVRLFDGAEAGRVSADHTYFFDDGSMWIEHGNDVLLVHDEGPGPGWVAPAFERAFLFAPEAQGTWWFSLP